MPASICFWNLSMLSHVGGGKVESIGRRCGVYLSAPLQRFIANSGRFLDRDSVRTLKECQRRVDADHSRLVAALSERKIKSSPATLQASIPDIANDHFRVIHGFTPDEINASPALFLRTKRR